MEPTFLPDETEDKKGAQDLEKRDGAHKHWRRSTSRRAGLKATTETSTRVSSTERRIYFADSEEDDTAPSTAEMAEVHYIIISPRTRSRTSPEQPAQYWKSDRGNDQCGPFWIIFRIQMFINKPNPNLARASPTGSTVSGRWCSPDPSHSSDASSATAHSTWAAHASNRSCPPTLTASRAHVGYASTGRPCARARRRRQAPRPL